MRWRMLCAVRDTGIPQSHTFSIYTCYRVRHRCKHRQPVTWRRRRRNHEASKREVFALRWTNRLFGFVFDVACVSKVYFVFLSTLFPVQMCVTGEWDSLCGCAERVCIECTKPIWDILFMSHGHHWDDINAHRNVIVHVSRRTLNKCSFMKFRWRETIEMTTLIARIPSMKINKRKKNWDPLQRKVIITTKTAHFAVLSRSASMCVIPYSLFHAPSLIYHLMKSLFSIFYLFRSFWTRLQPILYDIQMSLLCLWQTSMWITHTHTERSLPIHIHIREHSNKIRFRIQQNMFFHCCFPDKSYIHSICQSVGSRM